MKIAYTKKKCMVLGGDLRQIHLANRLAQHADVAVAAIESADEMLAPSIIKTSGPLSDSYQPDFLFLPMPTMSGDFVNAPMSTHKITPQHLVSYVGDTTIVFGGKIDAPLRELFSKHQIKYYDYLDREELAVMNALATAEGTLEIMLQELPVTIFGLNVIVIGSGRISKALRRLLLALGANVSVAARSHADLAWIAVDGANPISLHKLAEHLLQFDVVINTIPAKILTEELLSSLNPSALLIDLASKPGGVDFDEANRLGIRTIWALSLPGKSAPISSGEIIYRSICNIMGEEDIDL